MKEGSGIEPSTELFVRGAKKVTDAEKLFSHRPQAVPFGNHERRAKTAAKAQ
jgi:hypothetical protein